jgi:chitinase
MVREKTTYLKQRQLGGAMWWEPSGDRGGKTARMVNGSLIGTFFETITADGTLLESAQNALSYPESQYANLRAGFPGE